MRGPAPSGPRPPTPIGMPSAAAGMEQNKTPEGTSGAPGFRGAEQIESERCWNCKHWDGEARCGKFGNAAQAMDTCDGFEAGETSAAEEASEMPEVV